MLEEPALSSLWPGPHLLSACPLISAPRVWVTFSGRPVPCHDSASLLSRFFKASVISQKDSLWTWEKATAYFARSRKLVVVKNNADGSTSVSLLARTPFGGPTPSTQVTAAPERPTRVCTVRGSARWDPDVAGTPVSLWHAPGIMCSTVNLKGSFGPRVL